MHRAPDHHLLRVLTALLPFAAGGCEDPPRLEATLPVLELWPGDGATDVELSVVPRVTFGVPLDPDVVGPDLLRLWSGDLQPGGVVQYSVVDRSVTFTPSGFLRAHLAYAARLPENLRGIDGSTPAVPLEFVFVTGETDGERPAAPAEPVFDTDVAPILEIQCGVCHQGDRPQGGLVLWPAETLADLALRTSDQWIGWRILEPGAPERSYLMYKLTGAPGVIGDPMPVFRPLTREAALILERWIAAGARR